MPAEEQRARDAIGRTLWRDVGGVLLAGTGLASEAGPPAPPGPQQGLPRVYGLEQPAKTPRGPQRIPAARFTEDLQTCAEYCYVFQCNGCSSGSHLFRCTSRHRGDYFVCGDGPCGDHCRHHPD